MSHGDSKTQLKKLAETIRDVEREHNLEESPESRENIEYAFRVIEPRNFMDWVFIAYCGSKYQSVKHLADEYVKRADGELSAFYDHPLLELRAWCRPDTRRILVFREQIEALVSETVGSFSMSYLRLIWFGKISPGEYKHNMVTTYRDQLTDKEVKTIYEAIRYYAPGMLPFCYCATLVCRSGIC